MDITNLVVPNFVVWSPFGEQVTQKFERQIFPAAWVSTIIISKGAFENAGVAERDTQKCPDFF